MGGVHAALLVLVILGGVIWIARLVASRDVDAPRGRAAWLGPDPLALEEELRSALQELRSEGGGSSLEPQPAVNELARHHAHDMAMRNFVADTDPEGADHAVRRRRLHPDFVGRTAQWLGSFPPDPGQTPADFARSLLEGAGAELSALLLEPGWTLLGVGVAIEGGRGAVCVVPGTQWARLTRGPSWGPDAGWEVEGRVVDGTVGGQLSVRLVVNNIAGSPSASHSEPGWDEDRFALQIPAPSPNEETWVEIIRDGEAGLPRRLQ